SVSKFIQKWNREGNTDCASFAIVRKFFANGLMDAKIHSIVSPNFDHDDLSLIAPSRAARIFCNSLRNSGSLVSSGSPKSNSKDPHDPSCDRIDCLRMFDASLYLFHVCSLSP